MRLKDYQIGQKVQVMLGGTWYDGTINGREAEDKAVLLLISPGATYIRYNDQVRPILPFHTPAADKITDIIHALQTLIQERDDLLREVMQLREHNSELELTIDSLLFP